jgi:hypothetical protein
MRQQQLIVVGAIALGLYLAWEWLQGQCEHPSSMLYGGSTCSALVGTQNLGGYA